MYCMYAAACFLYFPLYKVVFKVIDFLRLLIPQDNPYIYIRCGLIMDGNETRYCMQCGSTLGLDCGEAEPDFNKYFCSHGCASKNVLGPRRRMRHE